MDEEHNATLAFRDCLHCNQCYEYVAGLIRAGHDLNDDMTAKIIAFHLDYHVNGGTC